jgi:hypothetical protein
MLELLVSTLVFFNNGKIQTLKLKIIVLPTALPQMAWLEKFKISKARSELWNRYDPINN